MKPFRELVSAIAKRTRTHDKHTTHTEVHTRLRADRHYPSNITFIGRRKSRDFPFVFQTAAVCRTRDDVKRLKKHRNEPTKSEWPETSPRTSKAKPRRVSHLCAIFNRTPDLACGRTRSRCPTSGWTTTDRNGKPVFREERSFIIIFFDKNRDKLNLYATHFVKKF